MLQAADKGHRIGHRLLLASALLALIDIDSASAQTTAFTYLHCTEHPIGDVCKSNRGGYPAW